MAKVYRDIETEAQQFLPDAQRGDHSAFVALVKCCEKWVYSVPFRYAKTNKMECTETDAKDVSQMTWLKVHRGLIRFKGTAKFTTWLYQVVHRCSSDYFRKKNKLTPVAQDELAELEEYNPVDPVANIAARELRQRIKQLPKKQKEVAILRFVDELSLNEISTLTKKPVGTVKRLISEAKKLLFGTGEPTNSNFCQKEGTHDRP